MVPSFARAAQAAQVAASPRSRARDGLFDRTMEDLYPTSLVRTSFALATALANYRLARRAAAIAPMETLKASDEAR